MNNWPGGWWITPALLGSLIIWSVVLAKCVYITPTTLESEQIP